MVQGPRYLRCDASMHFALSTTAGYVHIVFTFLVVKANMRQRISIFLFFTLSLF